MNKYITFTLVLFAVSAYGSCSHGVAPSYSAGNVYSAGPAVQQVALSSIPNIEHYLNGGAQTSYAATANNAPAVSVSYAPHAPAAYSSQPVHLAPATSVVVPQAHSYAAAPAPAAYGTSHQRSYGAAPKLSIQPAYATQLYPGQQNYKAYVSPPQHSKVALPILPSAPVAKLYVPQQSAYAAAPQPSYNSGAHSSSY